MFFKRALNTCLTVGAATTLALPAEAVPSAFTVTAESQTWNQGKPDRALPNTVHYQQGKIRVEMTTPVSAEGVPQFNVVLAREGSTAVTLLNPAEKSAMKVETKGLGQDGDHSLDFLSQFKVKDFSRTFRSRSAVLGQEAVAGEPCTIREQKGKDGHMKVWLSNRHEVPFKVLYFDGGKPAYAWTVKQFRLGSDLPTSAFAVPAGYQVVDISDVLNGMEQDLKQAPRPH